MRANWIIALALCAPCSFVTAEEELPLVEVSSKSGAEILKKTIILHKHPMMVKMLEENNRLRQRYGLAPQKISAQLTLIAQKHATWMARTGIFEHSYSHPHMENIAWNYTTPNAAFGGWESSPPHLTAILADAPYAGFGCVADESGSLFWVGVYGNPPKPDPADKNIPAEQQAAE